MTDIVAVMREMGLWPVHGRCRCGGHGAMTITENVAEWRCDRCGVFLTSATVAPASRPAPDVDAIAREAAERVFNTFFNTRDAQPDYLAKCYAKVSPIIREAIEKATRSE